MQNFDKVTRFEVIDGTGRAYVRYGVSVKLQLQDDDRTLKVFISKNEKNPLDKEDKTEEGVREEMIKGIHDWLSVRESIKNWSYENNLDRILSGIPTKSKDGMGSD